MDNALFICDKPTPARKIAGMLGIIRDMRTHMLCANGNAVVFTNGDMFRFLEPDEYDPAFAQWRKSDLPLRIPELVRQPVQSAGARLRTIGDLIAKTKLVVNAGFPSIDGQRVVSDILRHFGWKGPVLRMWALDGMEKPMLFLPEKLSGLDSGLEKAMKISGETEWRFKINLSRGMACMLNLAGIRAHVSYSRLQAAMLGMLLEKEIASGDEKYVPQFLVEGIPMIPADENIRLDENGIRKLHLAISGKRGTVTAFASERIKESPPLPYDLASLMRDAETEFSISPCEAMFIASDLYEGGYISWHDVSSRTLPDKMFLASGDTLKSLFGIEGVGKTKIDKKPGCFRDMPEYGYHAIIPTGAAWQKLGGKKLQIFKLIAKRFIQQFYPDKIYDRKLVRVRFSDFEVLGQGEHVVEEGWSRLDSRKKLSFPDFIQSSGVLCDRVSFIEQPENGYAENRILSFFLDHPLWRENPRMRAGIAVFALEGLRNKGYIETKNGFVKLTQSGRDMALWLPEKLKTLDLAVNGEARLADIAGDPGKADEAAKLFDDEIRAGLAALDKMKLPRSKNADSGICPACGIDIISRLQNKNGQFFWKCQNPECGKTFSDYKGKCVMTMECPACGEKAVDRHESKKTAGTFYWRCVKCGKFFDDNDGEMVPQLKCSICGEISLQRYESRKKPGVFYWRCRNKECGKFFGDNDGKPGQPFDDARETAKCPDCGGEAVRFESRKNPGSFFWKCAGCQCYFTDDNGKIGHNEDKDRKTDKCPVCGGEAAQFVSSKGNPYWRCKADKSHGPFSDENGRPGAAFGEIRTSGLEEADCPHCENGKAYKQESKNKPGTFFWRCSNCGLMSDDNGKPGKVFSAKK